MAFFRHALGPSPGPPPAKPTRNLSCAGVSPSRWTLSPVRFRPRRIRYLGLLLPLLLGACTGEAPQLAHGEPVPAFTLARLQTGTLTFPDDLRTRVVAIRFWADWCPFCAPEMKALEPVFRRHRERGLAILAVNVRQGRKTVRAFADKLGISYHVLLDEKGEVARAYGVTGLPTTFLVDHEGRLQSRILGESSAEAFERAVSDLLDSRERKTK
uniref:Peroxiredoxin n=1 Tax=Candidatus Kentrum sp. FM TaxID=2126340 RepID=A0A450TG22_9GAMM|nr:MAG: Peroxiredoxin [Candidatus Kentron sp. FM]VFJ66178.1 MAG: Peroxiredoxin [Candidatus Kentron sp. FM]VFK06479.1 MAG: Peroxiredoxin [Candidatus Kentron sp. FM]